MRGSPWLGGRGGKRADSLIPLEALPFPAMPPLPSASPLVLDIHKPYRPTALHLGDICAMSMSQKKRDLISGSGTGKQFLAAFSC